jgi:hypothetical protein
MRDAQRTTPEEAQVMSRSTRGAWLRAAASLAVIAVLTAGLAAACGGASGPAGLLEGKVTLGPITPVEQVGGPPNTRPYAATVDVETPEGDVVRTVEWGDDGTFSVRLAAGSYRLVPRSPRGRPFPHAEPLDATVVAGKTTTVEIAYDSGIR